MTRSGNPPLLSCRKPRLGDTKPVAAIRASNYVDTFYLSDTWRALRGQAMQRDRFSCVIMGCSNRAKVVDHRVPRRHGGSDALTNLRSLCAHHDAVLKETPDGSRAAMTERPVGSTHGY
jgi:5-methylcytosine-specific restriction endonuclease McrA